MRIGSPYLGTDGVVKGDPGWHTVRQSVISLDGCWQDGLGRSSRAPATTTPRSLDANPSIPGENSPYHKR